jgi:uroporphyrinogen decarboxylase
MNHRERFFAAVNHQPADRPPMDFVGDPWMYDRLVRYLVARDFQETLVKLDIDFRQLSHHGFKPVPPRDEHGVYTDIWGVKRRPVSNEFGAYDEVSYLPFANITDLKQVEDYPWPSPDVFDFSTLEQQCREYARQYVVIFGNPGTMDLINGTAFGRGMEQVLIDIALEDPVGLAIIEKRYQIMVEMVERALRAANGSIDILWTGDDYGTQNGPLCSVAAWKRLFAPKLQAYIDLGHKYGAKVMLHSCGSNRHLIPLWIDMGLDIYQTVQTEAFRMDAQELFREYGKHITFHGMIGVQSVLPHGTPADVRREVRARIRASGGSGYILAPSHNFQPDTPMENIVALYKAGAEAAETVPADEVVTR